ncbi:hypothetical protein CEUSTIGMA_g5672.t1 [Chlamydomonas eustigma]|uniref:PDZ domain-containing protein n=1 Tax=Chlamydomonas eustigma TaxID=1157962 RepID=A0A250X636_9CHLO|nr:hypothetical protein CEUSTIGMA_g5672.t1 [Chlamydomonas eustigma]|eukprot:GAX78230.1 hypothetical protein CEUSTIGMA_g5672.t1 [Chlamydomonas eustigma]
MQARVYNDPRTMLQNRIQSFQGSTPLRGKWVTTAQVPTSTLQSLPAPRSCWTQASTFSSDAIRDYDGRFGRGITGKTPSAGSTETTDEGINPDSANDNETLLTDLTEGERLTVSVFQENSPCIVNVSTTSTALGIFPFTMVQVPRGSGSGFIWDRNGHVITNSHVISSATGVTVTLYGGLVAKARVVGRDKEKDVAVLKLDLPAEQLQKLRPVTLGCSSNLMVGQKVLALGNPFGLDLSLTQGIVSGLGRELGSPSRQGAPITNVIQTDAAINPGNSGGPLLDSRGRLVGINTAIADPTGQGVFSGVGFAIPIDSVKGLVEQILVHGRVIRPALGLTIAPLPAYMSTSSGRPGSSSSSSSRNQAEPSSSGMRAGGDNERSGVLVVHVRPGGPADLAGIIPTRRETLFGRVILGDVITAINGKPIKRQRDLFALLDTCKVGQAVDVTLAPRGGEGIGGVGPSPAAPATCLFGSCAERGTSYNSSTRYQPQSASAVSRTLKVVLADRQKLQWGSE